MARVEDFIEEQAEEMSGVQRSAPGAAPYPLYGIPSLGQEEAASPFWRAAWFCYPAGAVAGFGLGYLVFGWLLPRMRKNPKKKAKEA